MALSIDHVYDYAEALIARKTLDGGQIELRQMQRLCEFLAALAQQAGDAANAQRFTHLAQSSQA
ncbi:hypothetical protein [Herpetosiphon geysericola]|uniref:Uncharacterized protein n=1 Tax=Herpetosiphon geysericola TaxID=70996 RepID=A0A0P6YXY1_9CHLR|nr:hypothetical protein [Herpetosiphon geysericola]KPL88972.1 hypothetical protein SE18_09970 [Herpetosiphon geysericola]